jgi:hypothetical protein
MNAAKKQAADLRNNSQLKKKLKAYTLAGAALAIPGVAKADIIYEDVDQTFTAPETSPYSVSYDFYLSGSPTPDIQITAIHLLKEFENPEAGFHANQVNASVNTGAAIFGDNTFPPPPGAPPPAAPLAFGALIDPSSTGWGTGGKMRGYWPDSGEDYGTWAPTPEAYLGFYFEGSGGPQAGWAHILTLADEDTASFTLYDYAYQTDAYAPIMAGQTSVIPEPSTMSLIALGGIGLIALRRRRGAKNA